MSTYDIVPTHLVVKAMRDSGYKNAAYAIAELMDNSIQAGAKNVELLCGERVELLQQRQRSRIAQIAVLDDGDGMDAEVLRMALQFGNGTRLGDFSGIGRFGMGLPNSSISQAQRVDVWTWQDGVERALHTYIDVKEIENGLLEVPEPSLMRVPDIWRKVGKSFDSPSGTLVVWSNLDRVMWRTARAIINNSEFLIGRMYRYFIHNQGIKIRLAEFDLDAGTPEVEERFALPNDPLYLLSSTSCPAPFDNTPMFQQWGTTSEFRIRYADEDHIVRVRFAYAKEEARETNNGRSAGSLPHGRHAGDNVGVSIVRAGRELDLDRGWAVSYDPTERWWGVEVEFPPALDDLFGVTNNKQSARNFSELAKQDIESLIGESQTYTAAREELDADQDPSMPLWEIANHINSNVVSIRALIKAQTKGTRGTRKRHEPKPSEEKATEVTRQRILDEYLGESDEQEVSLPPETRRQEILEELIEQGVTAKDAEVLAANTVGRNLKYTVVDADLASPAFFDVKSRGGAIIVSLNVNHPAYQHLVELLERDVYDADEDEIRMRLTRARDGLELLLFAWARYEDEQPDGKRRTQVQEARWDWGRVARGFLDEDE